MSNTLCLKREIKLTLSKANSIFNSMIVFILSSTWKFKNKLFFFCRVDAEKIYKDAIPINPLKLKISFA